MEKLIKIKARMTDGTISKHRTTSFSVKPFRNGDNEGKLYIKLDDNYTFVCKNIEVEQKEVEQREIKHGITQPLSSLQINDTGQLVRD